jgi:hypothetical protein
MRGAQGALVLLRAVLVRVSFASFFAVVRGMVSVPGSGMSVVSSLLMMTTLVMFGRFRVMFCGMGMVLGRVLMMLCCFRRHWMFPLWLFGWSAPPCRVGLVSDCRMTCLQNVDQ